MLVVVHSTIGKKELTFIGDTPFFDNEPEGDTYKEIGFFLYDWRDLDKPGRLHREWCFIPWTSCWVEKST